jgi:rhomboid protease GluP
MADDMPPNEPVRVELPDDLRQKRAAPPPAALPPAPPPPITMLVLGACIVVCAIANLAPAQTPRLLHVLAPSATQIWHGAVWGLVTTAFVHTAAWHILFNMMWARAFGGLLERDMGAARYLAFLVAAAFVSSGWQLATVGQTGIGFSGVVYALFGYTWARSRGNPRYLAFIRRGSTLAWMLGWLVLCIVLSVAKLWQVGNAAHVAGLVFGVAVGVVVEPAPTRWLGRAGASLGVVVGGVALAGAILSCVWMPWSAAWRARDALARVEKLREDGEAGDVHAQGQYGGILALYPESRARGIALLKKSAEEGDVEAMNGLAWALATSREDTLRNGAEAVAWAEKAVAKEPVAMYVDTLAAAYAETARWDEAVATQERALASLPPGDTSMRPVYEEHLAHFRAKQALRE